MRLLLLYGNPFICPGWKIVWIVPTATTRTVFLPAFLSSNLTDPDNINSRFADLESSYKKYSPLVGHLSRLYPIAGRLYLKDLSSISYFKLNHPLATTVTSGPLGG